MENYKAKNGKEQKTNITFTCDTFVVSSKSYKN